MLRVEFILPLVLSFRSRFWEPSIPGGKREAGYLLRSAAQRGTWFPHPLYRSTRSTFDPCAFMAHSACEFSSLTKLGCGSNMFKRCHGSNWGDQWLEHYCGTILRSLCAGTVLTFLIIDDVVDISIPASLQQTDKQPFLPTRQDHWKWQYCPLVSASKIQHSKTCTVDIHDRIQKCSVCRVSFTVESLMITTFGAMPQCQADELAGLAPPEVFVFHLCYVLNFCWNFFFLFAGVWWATSGNPAILREAVEWWGVLRCVEGWELLRTTTSARLCSRFLDQLYNQGMDAREPDLTRWLLVFAVQPGFQMWVEYCRAMRSCECIAWSLDRIMIESSFSE